MPTVLMNFECYSHWKMEKWAILSNHADCFYLHPEHDSEAYDSKFISVLRLITIQDLTALLLRTSIPVLRAAIYFSKK